MKALITAVGTFGPFSIIDVLPDRYQCDDSQLQFSVVGEGQIVDAGTVIWPTPPAPEPMPAPAHITRLAFRNRFTMTEKVTMELASLDSPAAPMAQRQQAAALRVSLADTAAAAFIDLDRPDTRAGVQMLESAGILAAGRALQILDALVQPEERPL